MRIGKLLLLTSLALAACGCRTLSVADETTDDESAENRGFALSNLRPKNLRASIREATGRGPSETAARELYQQGDELFTQASEAEGDERRELFVQAAAQYSAAAMRWPETMLEEDAMLMQGECYFFADHYADSRKAFDALVKKYPNTRHIDRVDARRFEIAQYWLATHRHDPKFSLRPNFRNERLPTTDTYGHAVKVFDKIRLDDPTGRLSDDATMAAGTAHFTDGNYKKAEFFFADLRKTYPESEHQFEAAFLGVKSKIQIYQGSDYDSQSLEEALALIEMLFQQFPKEVEPHREYLENAYKDIRVRLAARDWQTAQFYDHRKEYRGARHYYTKVIRDFSDTSLATDAEKRLAEIEGLPDKPPQYVPWLVEIVPKKDNQHKPLIAGDHMRLRGLMSNRGLR
jgi:outer membrane assembly lipoprotein YfiO